MRAGSPPQSTNEPKSIGSQQLKAQPHPVVVEPEHQTSGRCIARARFVGMLQQGMRVAEEPFVGLPNTIDDVPTTSSMNRTASAQASAANDTANCRRILASVDNSLPLRSTSS